MLLDLVRPIAHLELGHLLRLDVIAEDAFFVKLYPVVLVVVNVDTLHGIASREELLDDACDVALEGLCHGVIDAIVHALFQPQTSLDILHNLLCVVVAHGRRVTHVREEGLHAIAVITVQTVCRAYPHIASRVAIDAVHLRV